ncbi:MAG: M23 family metallopeptidase [Chloroflexota bacterium]|nr:M23 family metallopeptidase [Chloroflexota bacterium]
MTEGRPPRLRGGRRMGAWIAGMLFACGWLTLPPAASASGTGGTYGSPDPSIVWIACLSDCEAVDVARPGSVIRVRGANLAGAIGVAFLGAAGPNDDVSSQPRKVTANSLEARVPRDAKTGPVALLAADGRTATSSALLGVTAGQGVSPGAVDARVASRKVFFGARRRATLTYLLKGSTPAPVRVDLVRSRDNTVMRSWTRAAVVPGTPQKVEWNGLGQGVTAAEGRYEFRVTAGELARARSAAGAAPMPGATSAGDFLFLDHEFPIRGPHDYGTSVNRFGADRGGRSHMGQDVLADCGIRLVSARGGVVKFTGYQSGGAGNYIVIDGAQSPYDYVYMHLKDPALVRKGGRVFTGQRIGEVGNTGSSTACHLHFEIWQGPWFEGGQAIDPLPALKAWDRGS